MMKPKNVAVWLEVNLERVSSYLTINDIDNFINRLKLTKKNMEIEKNDRAR